MDLTCVQFCFWYEKRKRVTLFLVKLACHYFCEKTLRGLCEGTEDMMHIEYAPDATEPCYTGCTQNYLLKYKFVHSLFFLL